MGAARFGFVVVLALVAGCLESSVTTCADGALCVDGRVCSSQGCVLPEQAAACEGLDDGDTCTFSGVPEGHCVGGVCVSFACGNGTTEEDQGEACDDGNTVSGDGCRGDCQKRERCGDRLPDEGEACDDGNTNPGDGCDACAEPVWTAEAIVGGNLLATAVGLGAPRAVAVDRSGNVYIADDFNQKVRRVDAAHGTVTTVAGSGEVGLGGDGGAATSAQLFNPYGVAVDGLGAVFLTDFSHRIRRVDPSTGVITTIAGTGALLYNGDGIPATSAALAAPSSLAVDGLGNLYVADTGNFRVRRIDATTGLISTIAGNGDNATSSPDGGLATAAALRFPTGVALDAAGNVYISDYVDQRVRRVDAVTGVITTVAGTAEVPGSTGDGGLATAATIDHPRSVAVDGAGHLYVAEHNGNRVRRIDAGTGIITTFAGTGNGGFSADEVPAATSELWNPYGVAAAPDGRILISDTSNNRIRQVDPAGVITTIAGTGGFGVSGDGGAATSAQLHYPSGVAVDGSLVYFPESSSHRVRCVDLATGLITTIAGTAIGGFSGDGGLATLARLNTPRAVALDGAGGLYIAEEYARVRRVDLTTGIITAAAGRGASGYDGDDGPAVDAALRSPSGVAVDAAGNLYISDFSTHTIRKVDTAGVITTIAGTGTAGSSADGGAAVSSALDTPRGVAVDADGNVFLSDTGTGRVRRIDADDGVLTTIAGGMLSPMGLALDAAGNVYVAENLNQVVRRIAPDGGITTVAGAAVQANDGDGGGATAAWIANPEGVAIGDDGTIYVADTYNHRVRVVDPVTGAFTTLAGGIDPESMGPLAQAHLAEPRAFVRGPDFTVIAGGASGTVQRMREDDGWLEVVAGRYPQLSITGALARFRRYDFGTVGGVALDAAAGLIYLTETTADTIHVVTIVDPDDVHTWTIAPLAIAATLRGPTGLLLEGRTLYVADTGNHAIRAIDLDDGTMSTLAGTPGTRGFVGDGGPADGALLYRPEAITRCANGDVFIADTANHRVRRIDGAGEITTVLGDGVAASSGQGAPAREFPVRAPRGLACDALGNLYVSSSTAVRLVAADDAGVVDGSLEVNTIFGAPPRTALPDAVSFCLTGVVILDDATVQVTDACTGMLIELRRATPR